MRFSKRAGSKNMRHFSPVFVLFSWVFASLLKNEGGNTQLLIYFCIVKKTDWKLGTAASFAMSVIVVSFRTIRMDELHWFSLALAVLFYFLCGLLNWFVLNQLIFKSQKKDKNNRLQPALNVLVIVLLQFILDWSFSSLFYKALMLDVSGFKWYRLLVYRSLLVGGFYYFVVYHFYIQKLQQQNQMEISQLKEAQLQASLSSLKEQLSPHFMFNTLNTLSSISQEDNVKEYVTELSNVYRYLLSFQKKDTVTVQEELEFVTSYMYIIKARMEEAIDMAINISESTYKTNLPPLTLQLLIENTVKHNVASVSKPLRILITDDQPGWLAVSNNYQPRSYTQPSTGTGLQNIQKRYQLLFGKDIRIEQSEQFFIVKLPVI